MSFETRYNNLNEKQREAVDTIYGPVMVIAWPWSGKTELLAVRIANILKQTDALPQNILCLTFTEAAQYNMRERLAKIIGADAYKVEINTFHSFGNKLLSEYKSYFSDANNGNVDDITTAEILDTMIQKFPFDHPLRIGEQNEKMISAIKDAIVALKDAGIRSHDFEKILQKNDEILQKITPIVQKYFSQIALLWQKKADKIQRVELFSKMKEEIEVATLEHREKYHPFFENLSNTFLSWMEGVFLMEDDAKISKMITAWRDKNLQDDKITLKEVEIMKKNWALLEVYRQYENELQTRWLKDFSDMIISVTELIEKNETIRAEIAERFQWIMIDEYQDTNKAQLALIHSFTHEIEDTNIFCVGDDDQSIYKFQGANTENLRLFTEYYRDTKLIILNKNYRSYKEIIDFSREIVSDLDSIEAIFPHETQKKEFLSHRGEGGKIYKNSFENELDEWSFVVEEVKQIIENEKNNPNFSLGDIAIIAKKNKTLEHIWKLFLAHKIPVHMSRSENIFENEAIDILIKMLLFIDSVNQNCDDEALFAEILSHKMWGVHRLDVWEFARKMKFARKDENKNWLENLSRHENKNFAKVAHFFMELSILSKTTRLENIIDILTGAEKMTLSADYEDESEDRSQMWLDFSEKTELPNYFYDYYFNEEKLAENPFLYVLHLENVKKFISNIRQFKKTKKYLTIADFVVYYNLMKKYNIAERASTLIGAPNAVQCVTGHKSKGLEYKYVFVINVTKKAFSGKWPNNSIHFPMNMPLKPEGDTYADIGRMIYTMFTRAKDALYVSYSYKDINNQTEAIEANLAKYTDFVKNEQKSIDNCTKILKNYNKDITELVFVEDEKKFLMERGLPNVKISATLLQKFLNVIDEGPQAVFKHSFLNFPSSTNEFMAFGSAMHAALENLFKYRPFDKERMIRVFEANIRAEWFDENIESRMIEKGKHNIDVIFEEFSSKKYPEDVRVEYDFIAENIYIDDMKLTGKVDRIDIFEDDSMLIVDYKTGKSVKNLNEAKWWEGVKKWKMRLQLAFYEMLFRKSFKYANKKPRKYELCFVTPEKKTNAISTVEHYVQDGEVERVEQLATAIIRHIRELNFPDISHYPKDMDGIRQFEEDLIQWKI